MGLETSSEYFLKSAGILEYILDNFPESHDTDLLVENLLLLIQLMVLQAKEANYQKVQLSNTSDEYFGIEQEAAGLGHEYNSIISKMEENKCDLPYAWYTLVLVKQRHYSALADYLVAKKMFENDPMAQQYLEEKYHLGRLELINQHT